MIQSLWKNGFSVSSNLNLYSPSRNPTLRNLSKRNYNVCQRSLTHKYYTMFTFNNQNQKTQISILKWIGNKVWYIYKMQYNSALNRMITDTFNNTADSQKHDDDQKMPNTTFLGAWIPESKCWQVWFPLRSLSFAWASLVAQLVKNLPSMQETCIQSLGWEDSLQKATTTHSNILAWRIPWTI